MHVPRFCRLHHLVVDRRLVLGSIDSEEQVLTMATAASATLRLLPQLCQIYDSWLEAPPAAVWTSTQQYSPALLASFLVKVICIKFSAQAIGAVQQICDKGLSAAAADSLAGSLLRLHSLSCSMVHWLVTAGKKSALVPEINDGEPHKLWRDVIDALCSQKFAVCQAMHTATAGSNAASRSAR